MTAESLSTLSSSQMNRCSVRDVHNLAHTGPRENTVASSLIISVSIAMHAPILLFGPVVIISTVSLAVSLRGCRYPSISH